VPQNRWMVETATGLSAAQANFYGALPRSRLAAGALITSPAGDVLLVQPTYKPNREIPGGGVEAHEDAPSACVRECREELGLSIAVGRLLVLDHQLDPAPRGDSIMFVYDGGVLAEPTGIVLPAAELSGYAFVAPADLDRFVIPRLARRIRNAIDARRDNRVIELTGGIAWPP
jgi:8-oxo-dGTP diphosphatase